MRSFALVLSVTLHLLASSASASPRFNGSTGYQFSSNMSTVTINTGMIDNIEAKNTTGTIMVKLYATTTPYKSGAITGYTLASFKLDALKPGQFYRDLRKVVTYTAPPAKGTYYITLGLLEYDGARYVLVDHRNMSKTVALAPLELLSISSPWSWQTSYANRTVTLSVGKVSHRRTGHTGSLKIALWATETPYRGGKISGYQICSLAKAPLEPGYSYSNIKTTVPFTPPPDGTYFITLVLTESDGQSYKIVDYLTSSDAQTFNAP